MIQICGNWQFTSVINDIASSEEDNTAAGAAAEEEEELRRTDQEIQLEAAAVNPEIRTEETAEATKIAERGINEAAKEAEIQAAAVKATAFLWFLVRVRTYRCTVF